MIRSWLEIVEISVNSHISLRVQGSVIIVAVGNEYKVFDIGSLVESQNVMHASS